MFFGGKAAQPRGRFGRRAIVQAGPSRGVRRNPRAHAAAGGGGDIVTTDQFGDFEFTCRFQTAPKANSGIIYRIAEKHDAPWMTGPEYQVLDDAGAGAAATRAALGLDAGRASISASRAGDRVTVVVRYRSPTDVPLIGVFLGDITVTGAATMQVEP